MYRYNKLDRLIQGAMRLSVKPASYLHKSGAVICGCCFVSVNWIDPSKTLREQGIVENETLLLRRKFFFSDQNIDSRDPVQLNLLYVQARDAILDGTHPVTQEKACEFAGIQSHIQFGDHNENKHRPGFLE
jgi:talin